MAFFQGDELARPKNPIKIAVIGAGISGLYAGYLADYLGFEVQILEASDRYGGRIRPLENFADFPIELGAEEVHGDNSIWFEMLQHHKVEFVHDDGKEFYFVDNQLLEKSDLIPDQNFRLTLSFAKDIWKYEGNEDFSLAEYAKQKGIQEKYMLILESLLENSYGAPLRKISTKSTAEFDNNWSSGERNFIPKKQAYLEIIEKEFSTILPKIQLNKIVQKIDYQEDKIKITAKDKSEFVADKVIVTVPLPILKDGDIAFTPTLPASKIEAIKTIGIGAGMKIILKFKERFWNESAGIIYGGRFAQQYWMTGYGGKSQNDNVLTALISGDRAEFLSSQNEKATEFLLQDLDAMFHGKATLNFEKSHIVDWYKEPFIRGLYSFPSPNSEQFREVLAQSVSDKLFFAGEATNDFGHFATVHGAIETGYRAIYEILETVEKQEVKTQKEEELPTELLNKILPDFEYLTLKISYETRLEIAKKMLAKNYEIKEICALTNLKSEDLA